jgi:hypothetical protein
LKNWQPAGPCTRRLDAWLEFNGSSLPQKGNWHTLARELAVSPEALYRELARRKKSAAG